MAIDDKTRTELEAAVFRRLVEHLRSRTDVQNIDLMNLAGFCRNCLSNWLKDEADAKGAAMTKDESREAVYGMPHEAWKSNISGRPVRATRGDEEKPKRALTSDSILSKHGFRAYERRGTCGTAAMSTRDSQPRDASCQKLQSGMTFLRIVIRSIFFVEHDLFGKPVPTFPDHARVSSCCRKGDFAISCGRAVMNALSA